MDDGDLEEVREANHVEGARVSEEREEGAPDEGPCGKARHLEHHKEMHCLVAFLSVVDGQERRDHRLFEGRSDALAYAAEKGQAEEDSGRGEVLGHSVDDGREGHPCLSELGSSDVAILAEKALCGEEGNGELGDAVEAEEHSNDDLGEATVDELQRHDRGDDAIRERTESSEQANCSEANGLHLNC